MESRLDTSLGSVTLTVFLCLASVLLRLGAAAGFRSLVPLTSRGTDAPPGLTLGHSGIFATPPGLLLSGRKSLSCSCLSQVDGTVQGSSVHSPNTTGDPPHYDSFSPVVDSGGISRRAHFCCSDKDGAFQSVYDAPVGIAFASIGDTGLPGGELRRNSQTLAELSTLLDIRWVNLLGDNFYPHGVMGVDDPLWDGVFNNPFGSASLEKVAFFPILGNHDYYTDPYAQIAHYLRNATLPDLVTGVNPPSTSATLEGPSGSPPAADLAKLAQAHAVFPWIHVKKSNKGVEFLKNVRMQGVDGDRWRFPNYWYFTRHVFRNVPRHLGNPFKVNAKLDSSKMEELEQSDIEQREDVVVVTVYLDTMILIAEEIHESPYTGYKFGKDEIFTAQVVFLENVLKAAAQEADWIFICGHHPVVTDGRLKRNLPEFSGRVKDLMTKYRVDTYLSGHEHMLSFFQEPDMNDSSFIISGSGSKIAYRASCRRASCLYSQAETGFAVHLMSKKELHHAIVSADGVVRFTKTQHAQDRAGILSGGASSRSDTRAKRDDLSPLYPLIKRVYVGPYDLASITVPPIFPPVVYFAFGVVVPVLLGSCVLWFKKNVWPLLFSRSRVTV